MQKNHSVFRVESLKFLVSDLAALFQAQLNEFRVISTPIEVRIQTDSRQIQPGDIFIAIAGEKQNGHQFIPKAIQQGAIGVIAEKSDPAHHAAFEIIVPSTTQALLTAAQKALRKTNCKQIGITGSAGKTTMKEMLSAVLGASYLVANTTGNYNTPIGVPLSILAMNPDADFFVTELSASYPGEIDQNLSYLTLSDAIISSIGSSHLEFFHTVDKVLKEKMKISQAIVETGTLLLPGDNPAILSLPREKQFVYYGLNPSNDLRANHLEYRTNGIHFDAELPGESIPNLSLSAFGNHMVLNSLPVLFLARKYGIPVHSIREVLAGFAAPAGRGRLIHYKEGYCIIDETYNANPVSFKAALQAFDKTPFPRKILVFSDMLELGEGSATLHQRLADEIAAYTFHTVLYYGDYNHIMEPVLKKPDSHYQNFPSLEAMEQFLLQTAQPGDGILIKASNGKHLSEMIRHLESHAC